MRRFQWPAAGFVFAALVVLALGLCSGLGGSPLQAAGPKNPSSSSPFRALGRSDLEPHMQVLVGMGERHPEAAPQSLAKAADYIEGRFRAYGLVVRRQSFGRGLNAGVNVIGRLEGQAKGKDLVVVGAHYDSRESTPGADDNASGVAALLEVARGLSQARPGHAIELVAFSLEEQGFLGSRAYLGDVRPRANLRGVLILEALGYTCADPGCQRVPSGMDPVALDKALGPAPKAGRSGDFLVVAADPLGARAGELALADGLGRELGLKIVPLLLSDKGARLPPARLADHVPFWDSGLPALLITDTTFLRNPNYHRPTDKLSTIDWPFLAKAATLTGRLAWTLAARP